jgi:hypothetical protein
MMDWSKQRVLVWSLLACVVLMNALMAAPSVAHIEHHAKHTAAGHTGLCEWLCAASQAEYAAHISLHGTFQFVSLLKFLPAQDKTHSLYFCSFQRGPPHSDLA